MHDKLFVLATTRVSSEDMYVRDPIVDRFDERVEDDFKKERKRQEQLQKIAEGEENGIDGDGDQSMKDETDDKVSNFEAASTYEVQIVRRYRLRSKNEIEQELQ